MLHVSNYEDVGHGIDASHNYERAPTDGLIATTNWILAYLLEDPT